MSQKTIQHLLDQYGLICHSFAYHALPSLVQDALGNNNSPEFRCSTLTLLANVGPAFWSAIPAAESVTVENDRVDTFSLEVSQQILQAAGLADDADIIYPGNKPAPLIQLGQLAHWSTPSPLGLGLHSRYGPWLAYRALIKTSQPFYTNQPELGNATLMSPCVTCETTPCVKACPASAVSDHERFNIRRCANYRVEPMSSCMERCHARNACPVGISYRYSDEQHAYHMTHALQALIAWAAKSKT